MELKEILSRCDHTLLKQTAVWEDIRQLCDEGLEFGTASVCIPPCFVAEANRYLGDRLPVCTVIGFPNGYSSSAVKFIEAAEAASDGADELDMVANIGWIKAGAWEKVREEIDEVRRICGKRILKVIIETCLLTDEEKIEMCRVVSDSGADYIKTSTGFAGGGATREDVALLKAHIAPHLKIKAAGGIATLEDAEAFLALGADRLGTSRLVKLARQMQEEENHGDAS